MSFAVYPQPDACKAWMPTTPLPPSMSPPSPPMVCHMPAGHDGPHSNERRPTTLSRRWEGDARPEKIADDPRPAGEACKCGHAFDRHDGVVRGFRDACAGGTPGFCGCLGYRPAASGGVTDGEREATAEAVTDNQQRAAEFERVVLDAVGAFDASNDERRDRSYVRRSLAAALDEAETRGRQSVGLGDFLPNPCGDEHRARASHIAETYGDWLSCTLRRGHGGEHEHEDSGVHWPAS